MKKIIIISNTTSAILNFRRDLILSLLNKKYIVYCFAIDYTEQTKDIIKGWGAIPVDYVLSRGGMNPLDDIKNSRKLTNQIKEINPDIVFSSFVKPVIFGTLAAKRAGVKKVIAMLEGLGYFFTEQPEPASLKTKLVKQIQVLLYKRALPQTDTLIFLNNDDPKNLIQKHSIRVKNVKILGPIGVNLSEFPYSKAPVDPISFLFIGRLLKEKGIFEFLEAAKEVKKIFHDVKFYVLGGLDTENPGSLKKEVLDSYINQEIIEYPGLVSDVKNWIAKSSVFVLPSYREGFPRSTQEAMAMGRPVITTDVPGCRETVESGVNGFIVERWSANDLVEKMKFFIENTEKIIEMGDASFAIAKQKFDADIANDKLIKIIEN